MKAQVLRGSKEEIAEFNDGSVRTVDFGPFLRQSRNPLIQAYFDPAAFAPKSSRVLVSI